MEEPSSSSLDGFDVRQCEKCCSKIKVPGEESRAPFLLAAEKRLRRCFYPKDYLRINKPVSLPSFVRALDTQETKGFDAEYAVLKALQDSDLPIYVFYGPKPYDSKEELSDFVVVTQSCLIILEVKATAKDESCDWMDIVKNRVEKALRQNERASKSVNIFLKQHLPDEARINNEFPILSFAVLPNASRNGHSFLFDAITNSQIIFKDEIVPKLTDVVTTALSTEDRSHAARILLAWFYGCFYFRAMNPFSESAGKDDRELEPPGYHDVTSALNKAQNLPIKKPTKQPNQEKRKTDNTRSSSNDLVGQVSTPDQQITTKNMRSQPAELTRKTGKERIPKLDGIFLTKQQAEIIDSKENFLNILGPPATGKTYCLVAKIVQLYKEMMMEPGQRGMIIVCHMLESTLAFIRELCKSALGIVGDFNRDIIRFVAFSNLNSISELKDVSFKVFMDDYSYTQSVVSDWIEGHDLRYLHLWRVLKQASLCWCTSYSYVTVGNIPLSILQQPVVSAVLTEGLRCSGHIWGLAKTLQEKLTKDGLETKAKAKGSPGELQVEFLAATDIPGPEVEFILNTDICSVDEMWTRLQSYYGHANILEINNYDEQSMGYYTKVRGQEKPCVIATYKKSGKGALETLLDMVTRATSKVVIISTRRENVKDLNPAPFVVHRSGRQNLVSPFSHELYRPERGVEPELLWHLVHWSALRVHVSSSSCPFNSSSSVCDGTCKENALIDIGDDDEKMRLLIHEMVMITVELEACKQCTKDALVAENITENFKKLANLLVCFQDVTNEYKVTVLFGDTVKNFVTEVHIGVKMVRLAFSLFGWWRATGIVGGDRTWIDSMEEVYKNSSFVIKYKISVDGSQGTSVNAPKVKMKKPKIATRRTKLETKRRF